MTRLIILLVFFLLVILESPFLGLGCVQADEKPPTSYWPSSLEDGTTVEWDDSVTSPKEFFGFEVGQRHLDHGKLVAYLKQIASESPRVEYSEYGQTHGGRPLLLLKISSLENLENIDTIRKAHRQLAKPEQSVDVETAKLPAVINMGYGVHGDEASASNCSVLVAHYLAAAKSKEIDTWLRNCVILLDPCLNPDGFNRFANWVNRYRGRIPNDDPQHAEHNQGWPSGRVNYYWFDLNRDWLPLEQPESRARMGWYHAWKPNVVLDFHEMGTRSTYFFQPGVPNRTNPLTPAKNVELTNRFGEYHAKALDRRGSLYYTKEGFDDFYMGKGSTYPDLHGAVGILFEQASARGHVQKNQDGRLTFHEAIGNHFETSLSSLRATSDLRAELLDFKRQFYQDSVEAARKQNKSAIVFDAPGNRTRIQNFASLLLRHDIDCFWNPEGKLLVPMEQPEYQFLKSLLSRKKNFKENIFYDVSTWTLPLAYNLKVSAHKGELDFEELTKAQIVVENAEAGKLDAQIAYLVRWDDDQACRLLAELLERDVNVKVATRSFASIVDDEDEPVEFEPGTLLIPMSVQEQQLSDINDVLSQGMQAGLTVHSAKTGLTPTGSDFGSNRFRTIKKPSIAMLVGKGVAQYDAGEIWHLLDVKNGMQVSMLDASNTAAVDLSSYETFLLPNGTYNRMSDADWEAIASRIKNGATAVSVGRSCSKVFDKLNAVEPAEAKEDKDENEKPTEKQLPFDSASKTKALKLISGSIFRVQIDRTHPLFFGYRGKSLPVFRNHGSFLEPSENPYANPAIYDAQKPHLSGYCSPENVEKFKTAASVVVRPIGKGRLIQISDNPNFRAFWHGTSRMYLNAIFFGDMTNPQ